MSAPFLNFDTPIPHAEAEESLGSEPAAVATPPAGSRRSLLAEEDLDVPPTWSEGSAIFHTTEKCTRLQSIRRNRRITGNPGLRQHCLNCLDITATKRRG